MNWQTLTPQPCELGESPFWHPHEQLLYWIDISGKKILRANVYMGTVESWDMPSEPGCMAPAASGGLVIALRHGVFRARAWGGSLQLVASLDYDPAHQRANPTLRTASLQRFVYNIELNDLRHALMKLYRLPELLVRISDGKHPTHANVRNVLLAVRLARHTMHGWDNAALPDDINDIALLLNASPRVALAFVHKINHPV